MNFMWWITQGLRCLTFSDLQGLLQSKDSAQFETKVALRVPGTENSAHKFGIRTTGLLR